MSVTGPCSGSVPAGSTLSIVRLSLSSWTAADHSCAAVLNELSDN